MLLWEAYANAAIALQEGPAQQARKASTTWSSDAAAAADGQSGGEGAAAQSGGNSPPPNRGSSGKARAGAGAGPDKEIIRDEEGQEDGESGEEGPEGGESGRWAYNVPLHRSKYVSSLSLNSLYPRLSHVTAAMSVGEEGEAPLPTQSSAALPMLMGQSSQAVFNLKEASGAREWLPSKSTGALSTVSYTTGRQVG